MPRRRWRKISSSSPKAYAGQSMTIFYVTTGAWGAGTGTPNTAAQVDGNFYDVDQRIVSINAELADGKMIESVSYTQNSFTLHFTDGTTQVIPLPIATMQYVGEWLEFPCLCARQYVFGAGHRIFSGAGRSRHARAAGAIRSRRR